MRSGQSDFSKLSGILGCIEDGTLGANTEIGSSAANAGSAGTCFRPYSIASAAADSNIQARYLARTAAEKIPVVGRGKRPRGGSIGYRIGDCYRDLALEPSEPQAESDSGRRSRSQSESNGLTCTSCFQQNYPYTSAVALAGLS